MDITYIIHVLETQRLSEQQIATLLIQENRHERQPKTPYRNP